jgi:protocatechuate 3,4-dioxygenase beta subunit
VRHLHAFAREISLTPAEWLTGIGFLTEVGQKCTPFRQEFILLSDVLGVSALVNLLHDKTGLEKGTDTSLLGPFFRNGAPRLQLGDTLCGKPPTQEISVYGQVTDRAGHPVPHATMEVWQTDETGLYDLQAYGSDQMDMRGGFVCDAQGKFHFRTTRAIDYPIPLDGPVGKLVQQQNRHGHRPAHIHFMIAADGFRELVTALYLADSEHIDSDTVFGVARSLVVAPRAGDPNSPIPGMPAIHYDFQLAHAAADDTGRVGADPSQFIKAAE